MIDVENPENIWMQLSRQAIEHQPDGKMLSGCQKSCVW